MVLAPLARRLHSRGGETSSERQEALRQGPRRQVQCSQLKGYRESKGLGVGKGEVVLEIRILRKIKNLSWPPAEKEGPSPTESHSTCVLSPSTLPVNV